MELIRFCEEMSYDNIARLAVTIGCFDGLHFAHQKIIKDVVKYAKERDIKSCVITFDPHPDYFLKKREYNGYISSMEEKIKKIEKLKVDYLIVINFNEKICNLTKEEFVNRILKKFKISKLFVGYDFTFGHKGEGNPSFLKEYYSTTIIDKITYNDNKIASEMIRDFLKNGEVDKIKDVTGEYFQVEGKVENGNKIGRIIGIKTANIDICNDYPKLKYGVYKVYAIYENIKHLAICNYGLHPSIKIKAKPILEVNIFDFDKDIYNKTIKIEFCKFIREEKKFSSLEELKKQIEKDINEVRNEK